MRRSLRLPVFVCAVMALALPEALTQSVQTQSVQSVTSPQPTEAPTGFDGEDNGFLAEFCASQAQLARVSSLSPAIPAGECNMDAAIEEFTGPETASDGLGPIFNAAGCGECHIANPVLGATSQITETRAGLLPERGSSRTIREDPSSTRGRSIPTSSSRSA